MKQAQVHICNLRKTLHVHVYINELCELPSSAALFPEHYMCTCIHVYVHVFTFDHVFVV